MGRGVARAGAREWLGLVALAFPPLLISVDFTVLHLALPQLSAALAPTATQQLWIVDSYGFAVAGLLITMGTLGDRIGRRRLLLIGAGAFGVASALAAYAPTAELLIAARILLGVTGATLLPTTIALITVMFQDRDQRRFAIAVWATAFVVGSAVGPVIGGVMLEFFWWGSVFLLAVPVMVALLVAGPLLVPESREPTAGRLDLASVVLLMGAVVAIVFGVKQLAAGSGAGIAAVAIGAGVVATGWFVRRQRRQPSPLLDLELFSRRAFSVPLVAQLLCLFVIAALQYLLMQYLQLVLDLSPLSAGLWTLPGVAAGIAGNLSAPALARWFSPVQVIIGGLLVAAAGLVVIMPLTGDTGLVLAVTGFAVVGLGINPVMVLSYDLILNSAPPERAGTASGAAETGNELGLSLGVALAGSVGAAVYRSRLTPDTLPPELSPAQQHVARETLGGAVGVAQELPDGPAAALLSVAGPAFTAGLRLAAGLLALVMLAMAVTTAVLLRRPHRRVRE